MSENNLGDYDVFMSIIEKNKWEGYLYPQTYFFSKTWNEKQILNLMVKEFHKATDKLFQDFDFSKFKKLGYNLNKEKIIILASMIEKEAKVNGERALVSAVFHNRLKKHWRLESCATVQYALGETRKKLYYKDLKIDSPYNTYINFGLPVGPICNPGFASIKLVCFQKRQTFLLLEMIKMLGHIDFPDIIKSI